MNQSKILIVDDDISVLSTLETCLSEFGFYVVTCSNPLDVVGIIAKNNFDLIFLDIQMSPIDGFTVLTEIKKLSPDIPVIIISGSEEFDFALRAVEMGAYHILQKPMELKELIFFTKKAIEYQQIKFELKKIKDKFKYITTPENIITQNRDLLEVIELAETVADSDISILIRGESGTGKELMAEFIHEKSSRKNKPLIKVNCAAIPEGLLESELFGHVKGAFTGASKDRKGRFELADGGTLFLDEVGEMPTAFQAKLLRVLQSGQFESVGDSKTKKVNVRIISATNVNIEAGIEEKTFREDLFYRLNGVTIPIPPLRERPEDIELLVKHFIEKFSKNKHFSITDEALLLLKNHSWRGNVRELENTIHRVVLLAKDAIVDTLHLPPEIKTTNNRSSDSLLSLEKLKELHIKKVLEATSDFKETARILKIDLATLWRKRKKYSI
ncbi:MAG: sigma-54-dependent Fis family transcriptional regulator [Leptospiraceae bacterium]|nr:sigma-54-dependent Fis family transcriptional regulator [Leptospiraceae bacterium]